MSTQLAEAGITLMESCQAANLSGSINLVVVGNALSRGNPGGGTAQPWCAIPQGRSGLQTMCCLATDDCCGGHSWQNHYCQLVSLAIRKCWAKAWLSDWWRTAILAFRRA